MITVRIGATEFPLEQVLENPGQHVRALERAKTTLGFAECGCVGSRPRPKLVIRRCGSMFVLAQWPNRPQPHAPTCPFERRNGGKSAGGSDLDAFRERDGILDVKLDASFKVSTRTPARAPQTDLHGNPKKAQRRTAGLLAFLEYAWEQAGLHRWPGSGGRGWSACWSRLSGELADAKINGRPAEKVLHIVEKWEPARKSEILADFGAWLDGLTPSGTESPRGLLLAEIVAHKASQFGGELELRQTKQRLFMGAALYQRLQRSFGTALAGAGQSTQRCVAALLVEKPKAKNYLTVVDAAAMLTDSRFLPCDSTYEVTMSDYLVANHRAFRKPLRHIGNAPVHPDFVLNDTSPEVVIEVLGMTGNPEYDARMAAKRAHYRAAGVPVIEWNASVDPVSAVRLPAPARSSGEVGGAS